MDKKEVEYLQGLLEIFKIEAQEHLNAMSNGLIELEKLKAEDQGPLVETIYREAHSLKGAARAVNMGEVESVCQKLESVFAEMKRTKVQGSPALLDALHRAVTELDLIMQTPHMQRSVAEKARTQKVCRDLESIALQLFGSPKSIPPPMAAPAEDHEPGEPRQVPPTQRKPHKAPPAVAKSRPVGQEAPAQPVPRTKPAPRSVATPFERSDARVLSASAPEPTSPLLSPQSSVLARPQCPAMATTPRPYVCQPRNSMRCCCRQRSYFPPG